MISKLNSLDILDLRPGPVGCPEIDRDVPSKFHDDDDDDDEDEEDDDDDDDDDDDVDVDVGARIRTVLPASLFETAELKWSFHLCSGGCLWEKARLGTLVASESIWLRCRSFLPFKVCLVKVEDWMKFHEKSRQQCCHFDSNYLSLWCNIRDPSRLCSGCKYFFSVLVCIQYINI